MDYLNLIQKSLEKVTGIEGPQVTTPEREEFGDYSTNVALVSAKSQGLSAKQIKEKLEEDKDLMSVVEKIEIVNGFINFFIKTDVLLNGLKQIDVDFGKSELGKGKHYMVEFAHPNTHKAFHIGHLRNITTGESIVRILEANGYKITRANYQGDVGLHIAKALWGIKKLGLEKNGSTQERAKYLGKAYTTGSKAYEDDKNSREEIININKSLYQKSDEQLIELYKQTRQWSLDYFELIYKRVYTKFDRYYFESEVFELGQKLAEVAKRNKILIESKGAIIFEGSKHGLHDRVFITGEGNPTYEAKDLGLAKLQFEEYKPDMILHVVGPEQAGYFQVLFKAMELIFPLTKGKEKHLQYGWVRLKQGKMSSRLGNVILGEDLLNEVKNAVVAQYKSEDEISEQIAVSAIKYALLKSGLTQDVAYDLHESVSLQGNSGPYLQYTYARTQSVLKKNTTNPPAGQAGTTNEELLVLRHLLHFPEVIERAAKNYAPNIICDYLYQLASKYNTLYNAEKILGNDFRILLTDKVGIVLKSGLTLLGIKTPSKM